MGFPSDNIDRQNADIVPALYWSYFMQVLYNPILALVKSSVLVLLLRIGSHRASIKWTIYVLQFLNLSLMVAIFFTILLQRIPIRAYWDPSVETRFKINSEQFIIVSAAITIVGDILVLVIPIWLFVGLRMRLSMKLGLICIFLLSGLCVILLPSSFLTLVKTPCRHGKCSTRMLIMRYANRVTCIGILRLVIIHHSFSEPKYDYIRGWDTAWSQIESTLAIIAACIPPLRPLLTVLMPGLFPPAGSAQPGVDSEACFATATVGGTKMPGSGHRRAGVQQAGGGGDEDESFELKHMGRSRAGVRAQAPSASQEDMMAGPGASEAITRVGLCPRVPVLIIEANGDLPHLELAC